MKHCNNNVISVNINVSKCNRISGNLYIKCISWILFYSIVNDSTRNYRNDHNHCITMWCISTSTFLYYFKYRSRVEKNCELSKINLIH